MNCSILFCISVYRAFMRTHNGGMCFSSVSFFWLFMRLLWKPVAMLHVYDRILHIFFHVKVSTCHGHVRPLRQCTLRYSKSNTSHFYVRDVYHKELIVCMHAYEVKYYLYYIL